MYQRLLQICILLSPLLLLLYLLRIDINPSGVFEIRQTVGELSPYIDRLLPDTRVLGVTYGDGGAYQLVIGEPTYLSIHPPGEYETVRVELMFQNESQPIIEIGLVVNEEPLQYTLEPLQNLVLDQSLWPSLEENGITLFQRKQVYESITAFEADPPQRSTIATFHHELAQPYQDISYQPTGLLSTVRTSLRGYHEYLTYIKNEPLMLQTAFMDMNRQYGDDPIELLAVNENGEIVGSTRVEDDGEIEATQQGSGLRNTSLVVSDLPEGVYKVIMKAGRDIFFRSLTTRQRYMTFVGPVFIGDEVGYRETPSPVSFLTNGKHLSFETYHADAAQEVTIGSDTLLLPEAKVRYDHEVLDAGLVSVSAEAGDFFMTGDGKVAFMRSQFFNPDPVRLSSITNLDDLGIDFIIAEYTSPEKVGDWLKASAMFELSDWLKKQPDIKFVLSAPNITNLQNEIRVHEFRLKFERPPLDSKNFLNKVILWIGELF
ncbi:MAG: hypothetical protein AAB337_00670 [Patescibacteria group bacterium]|mgnify:FL=1